MARSCFPVPSWPCGLVTSVVALLQAFWCFGWGSHVVSYACIVLSLISLVNLCGCWLTAEFSIWAETTALYKYMYILCSSAVLRSRWLRLLGPGHAVTPAAKRWIQHILTIVDWAWEIMHDVQLPFFLECFLEWRAKLPLSSTIFSGRIGFTSCFPRTWASRFHPIAST